MITSYSNTISVTTAGSLLLDDYPNAAAAYSLRKLRGPYIGDAIRVRRASDNTELNIGFVNNELDTATLETFCSSTDGFVTTWYDQSGNANNATQTTAANQPQIVSSGSVILSNGKVAMNFDGSNDTFNTTLSFTTFTAFHVAQQLSVQSAYRSFYGGTNAFRYSMGQEGTNLYYIRGTSDFLVSTITRDLNQNFYYALVNGTNSELQINNNFFSGSLGTPASATNFSIGGDFFGHRIHTSFQELIFYNSNQSANKNGILSNLNNFY